MALYTKHRTDSWSQVLGQTAVVTSLKATVGKKDPPHTYLLTGKSGCGKTTSGRLLGPELGAKPHAVIEINCSNYNKVEDARRLLQQINFRVPGSKVTVFLLEEVHRLTEDAQNALLTVLEEPPEHIYFILCTTEPEKLLPTVRQRAMEYRFAALQPEAIMDVLFNVVDKEQIELTEEVALAIIDKCDGSARLALIMLEKCIPVAQDIKLALPLLENMVTLDQEGPYELAKEFADLFLKQSGTWDLVATFLSNRILGKRQEIPAFKRSLLSVFGYYLLKGRLDGDEWIIQATLDLENSLFGASTDGGFIALVRKIWKLRTSHTNGTHNVRERNNGNGFKSFAKQGTADSVRSDVMS